MGHYVYINIAIPQWNIVKLLYLCSLCALQCNNYAHESTEVCRRKSARLRESLKFQQHRISTLFRARHGCMILLVDHDAWFLQSRYKLKLSFRWCVIGKLFVIYNKVYTIDDIFICIILSVCSYFISPFFLILVSY